MTQENKIFRALKAIVCISLVVGFMVTKPLWLSERLWPLIPIFSWLPTISYPYDLILYVLLLFLLCFAALRAKATFWIAGCLIVNSILAVTDQSRWHPWFYWDSFILIALCFSAKTTSGLNACRTLVIGSYFWAGIQKINVTFFHELFPWMLSTIVTNPQSSVFWSNVAFCIPPIEITLALLLLIPKYRKFGILLAVVMHIFILVLLGPLGNSVNSNIWPWNVGLICLVVTLFSQSQNVTVGHILCPRSNIHALAFILFLIMPIFTFFDLWDAYPGFSLYSGSQRSGYIQLDLDANTYLPVKLQNYVDDRNRLRFTKWAMGELNTPEYAEPRIYKGLLEYICKFSGNKPNKIELVILSKPDRLSGERVVELKEQCP